MQLTAEMKNKKPSCR